MGTLFAIAYHEDALKGLQSVEPKKIRQQVAKRINALAEDPKPQGCAKVQGMSDGAAEVYRVRQGDYRILYSVVSDSEILILDIGHRKDIYRR
jgi:mRNA interferase RelE/StbE